MKSRPDSPRHLDVEACAKAGIHLHGEVPLHELPRLLEMAHAETLPAFHGGVRWQAQGEARAQQGSVPQIWLHLRADTDISLVCQRCLGAVAVPVQVDRSFRFVVGEDEAAALDAEIDDDVMALPRTLDLQALLEDELLLALPLVPRHDPCPEPLVAPRGDLPCEERPHPFAALADLKPGGASN